MRSGLFDFAHVLIGKPVPTFPGHAPRRLIASLLAHMMPHRQLTEQRSLRLCVMSLPRVALCCIVTCEKKIRLAASRPGGTAMMEIRRLSDGDPLQFEVNVRDGAGQTHHRVTMTREMYERLTAGAQHTPEQCLEAAFRFLLDREPKEAILQRFDIAVISRYFADFERQLPSYLARL